MKVRSRKPWHSREPWLDERHTWLVEQRRKSIGTTEWFVCAGPMSVREAMLAGKHRAPNPYTEYRIRHRQTNEIILYADMWSHHVS